MRIKRPVFYFISSFFFVSLLFPAGAYAQSESAQKPADISNIQRMIMEKTPKFISAPLGKAIDFTEAFRLRQVEKYDNPAVFFIFNNRIIFYFLLIFLVFLIIRMIIHFVFRFVF